MSQKLPSLDSVHRPFEHKMIRRSIHNDYRARRIYMITLMKGEKIPPFSRVYIDSALEKKGDIIPAIDLNPIGKIIDRHIMNITDINPVFEIFRRVIMPDHIHFIIYVKERIDKDLGNYIAIFKKSCTQSIWKLYPKLKETKESCFQKGINDRILLREGQLDRMKKYIEDNPRRLLIKRKYKNFFQRILGIEIGDRRFDCYGNPFLITKDLLEQVQVRSTWSESEFETKRREWQSLVNCGAILVSPFISHREKIIRDDALKTGGNLIIIRDEKFPPRFKPSGRYFDLCAAGRLLLIVENDAKDYSKSLSRKAAMNMNNTAAFIASAPISARRLYIPKS